MRRFGVGTVRVQSSSSKRSGAMLKGFGLTRTLGCTSSAVVATVGLASHSTTMFGMTLPKQGTHVQFTFLLICLLHLSSFHICFNLSFHAHFSFSSFLISLTHFTCFRRCYIIYCDEELGGQKAVTWIAQQAIEIAKDREAYSPASSFISISKAIGHQDPCL